MHPPAYHRLCYRAPLASATSALAARKYGLSLTRRRRRPRLTEGVEDFFGDHSGGEAERCSADRASDGPHLTASGGRTFEDLLAARARPARRIREVAPGSGGVD